MKPILSFAALATVAVMLSACAGNRQAVYSDTPYEDRTAGRGTVVYTAQEAPVKEVRKTDVIYRRAQVK